jgi:poly-gamma-glutamate synthesis protein (capsule biosynthesis protein)
VRDRRRESSWAIAGWDRDRAIAAVETARAAAEGVIVSIHWGYEYETRVDPAQRDIARELVAAGADLVIGHHRTSSNLSSAFQGRRDCRRGAGSLQPWQFRLRPGI